MGGAGSGRKSSATMECPNPAHAGSRVKRDGRYGPDGHKRQMYRCVPGNGDKPHRFTEALPREEAWETRCDVCERPIAAHEGPHSARRYQFVARGIAGALVSVGAGATYTKASRVARARANRERFDPVLNGVRQSSHGQLVADWVEVFAPLIFERFAPTEWPTRDTLLLDHMPFRIRAYNSQTGSRINGGIVAFDVFAAAGYVEGRPQLWRMEAFPNAGQPNWMRFLRGLPGEPKRVVCDNHSGMTGAIRALWPNTDLYLCEWHLRHALERLIAKQMRAAPKRKRRRMQSLQERVAPAFYTPKDWQFFESEARSLGNAAINDWMDKRSPIVLSQFSRYGSLTLPVGMPRTTSALEALTRPIRDALHPRRYGIKNRERTNRLLMLMQLNANDLDNETAYRRIITEVLEANAGRPPTARRAVIDSGGVASLR